MKWDDRLLRVEDLTAYVVPPSGGDASRPEPPHESGTTNDLARALLRQQTATWPMLHDAVVSFDQARYERFPVKGSEVLAQFNPKRIVSAGAKVDAATIGQRACFLCPENLPAEEKGIPFGDCYVILCNPFPVLRDHLVIASRAHTPQAIEGHVGELLNLTRELGQGWFTLYNGPRCGASAPDHLHFQACSSQAIPLFAEAGRFPAGQTASGITLRTLEGYRLNLVAAQSADRDSLVAWFNCAVSALADVTETTEEPMLNLVAQYDGPQWTVFVFPRAKHRPDCYFAEGDAQLLVSPGAIDLAGVMVVPNPDHFAKITAEDLERIYAEVTLDDARFGQWLARIN